MTTKTGLIDGVRVISTTELCVRLGLTISSTKIVELQIGKPFATASTGVYWKEEDLPFLATGIASHLLKVAAIAFQNEMKLK